MSLRRALMSGLGFLPSLASFTATASPATTLSSSFTSILINRRTFTVSAIRRGTALAATEARDQGSPPKPRRKRSTSPSKKSLAGSVFSMPKQSRRSTKKAKDQPTLEIVRKLVMEEEESDHTSALNRTPNDSANLIDISKNSTKNSTAGAVIYEDDAHPLRDHLITRAAWNVLMKLRANGHEVYIVGGTVRDILLGKVPKDFDILTSAEPQQVAHLFPRAFVLGRNFPICHVHHDGEIIEVSSFSTNADPSRIPLDAAASTMGRDHRREARALKRLEKKEKKGKKGSGAKGGRLVNGRAGEDRETVAALADAVGTGSSDNEASVDSGSNSSSLFINSSHNLSRAAAGPTWALARRDNACKRDFTCNGLLYDPFSRILYDYVGGVEDCVRGVLRTLGSPVVSFNQDPARILRAVRLAARAELRIDDMTARAMAVLAPMAADLPQGRLQMELAAMLTHGAAKTSVQLMWRFGLLDMLLPHHAALLTKERYPRDASMDLLDNSNSVLYPGTHLLFTLLGQMDSYGSAQNSIDNEIWMSFLAVPLIAEECKKSARRRELRRQRSAAALNIDDQQEVERNGAGAGEKLSLQKIKVDASVGLLNSSPETPKAHFDISDNSHINTAPEIDVLEGEARASPPTAASSDLEESPEEESDLLDETPSAEYLEAYGRIVDKVMGRLLSPPDRKVQKTLAAAPPTLALSEPLSKRSRRKKTTSKSSGLDIIDEKESDQDLAVVPGGGADEDEEESIDMEESDSFGMPTVPCILPRQAVELAREFLKLEAELRGQDLPGVSDGKKARTRHRHKRLRRLASNEQLVLQLLRAPEVQWAEATKLGL